MKIGLLSDTHGNHVRTAVALRLLREADVQAILHAGDVGDAAILTELGATFGLAGVPVHAVAGNVDAGDDDITGFPASAGVQMHVTSARLAFEGRKLFMTHGHHAVLLDQAIASGQYDLVIHGHTHLRRDEKVGSTRVVNPGAVHRAPEPGVAVLDLATGALRFLNLA